MNEKSLIHSIQQQLAPPLSNDKHKGQSGRIGIFGGSLEYTGAPYFAAITSLKVGADLVYVFCTKDSASVIKSYSPELIVMPHLDADKPIEKIEPWLDRLHTILIGPGLGRDSSILATIEKVIEVCKSKKKPLVIDADGLFLISNKMGIIKNYSAPVVLTPNAMEFKRLIGNENVVDNERLSSARKLIETLGKNVTVLCKDKADEIITSENNVKCTVTGSGRRCGGQGDLLSGALSTFLTWALQEENTSTQDLRPILACYAAAKLTRDCNRNGFAKHGRSMTCTDMIKEIHVAFEAAFERS